MEPCPDDMALVELVSGSVPDARKADLESHLAECASCRETIAILLKGQSAADESHGTLTTPEDVVSSPLIQPLGEHVGRYEIGECLGAGGMGVVYAAHDPKLDRQVALKVVRNAGPSAEIRLLREAQAMARLAHPNVVTVHDVIAHQSELVIAMELVPGTTLAHWLVDRKRSWSEIVAVFVQAGLGLEAAHKAGLVHRDFKPSNVFVRDDGRVQVGDFGLARLAGELPDDAADVDPSESPLEAEVTRRGTLLGTPRYMAPEQQSGHADERSDQFSFAVALRECLGDRWVPKELRKIIARGSAHDPAERFPSIAAAVEALGTVGARKRPRWALVAAAGVVVAGAAVGIAIASRGSEPTSTTSTEVSVAMLPFADHTRNAQLDFTHSGLPRLLGTELQRAGIRVIGTYELRDRTPNPPPLDDVFAWRTRAVELGARFTVSGVLEGSGTDVAVAITLARGDGIAVGSWVVSGAPTAIPDLVGARADRLVAAIGGNARKASEPRDFSVERDLTNAIEAFQQLRHTDANKLLGRVVAKQPSHAEARYYLALVAWWANAPQHELEEACSRALQTELLPEQAGVITGLISLARNEFDKAIDHFRRLDEQFSTSSQVRYALSESLYHGGYPAEGMTVYRQLVELVPRWHLALVHPLTYYTVHADKAGMEWAYARLPLLDSDSAKIWQVRREVLARDYRKSLASVRRARADVPGPGKPLETEMLVLATLLDEPTIAAGLTANPWHALAVAGWRGDRAAFDKALQASFDQAANDRQLRYNLVHILRISAIVRDPEVIERTLVLLDRSIGTTRPNVSEELARVFAYGILERGADLAKMLRSPFPEVATVAAAFTANLEGKPARDVWQRAIGLSADGLFVVPGRFEAARALAAAKDPGVIAQCDELLRPHYLDLALPSSIAPCLAWSAVAHERAGKRADAVAMYARVRALRPEADPLHVEARAGLERLR